MAETQFLFEHSPNGFQPPAGAASAEETAAKAVIDKLLKVRRSLSEVEEEFAQPRLNLLIEEFRSLVRSTPTQREEQILYAIEVSGCTTETEISEDTRLHRSLVKTLISDMTERGILYRVSRHVPGSGRPQYAIKSRRLNMPEVE